jgi:hypothetical protein
LYLPGIIASLITAAVLFSGPLDDWSTVAALRRIFPVNAKPVGYWRGSDAAFLAVSVPGKAVQSVVRVDGGKVEIRFDGQVRTDAKSTRISSLDLDGVRAGDAVVLFHTEAGLARSAISFDTGTGGGRLRYIVTGVAPGMWEVWRDGWVVDIGVPVRRGEGVLYFEDRPGSYFIRRLD